jgi:glycine C-acetyltransferase
MNDLEEKLIEAKSSGARRILIATDGVFSMDGIIAQVDKICDLAEKYDALVMVDDCHATGFTGKTGRGSSEHNNAYGRVDIITGTFGKALGGASGGFTAASKEIVEMLRQRSRPYLFSNTLAPAIVGASIKVIDILSQSTRLRDKLETNTKIFRKGMTEAGFDIVPGTHPIVPVMLYDAKLSQEFSKCLLEEGIYVIGFFFPVVPKNKARIRVQISAGHEEEHIQHAIKSFIKVGKKLSVI